MTYEQAMTVARNFIADNNLYGYKVIRISSPLCLSVTGTNAQGPQALTVGYTTK